MTKTFGPAANWKVLTPEVVAEHPLFKAKIIETLVHYDGPIVALSQIAGDDRVYLRIAAHSDHKLRPGGSSIGQMMDVVHYLEFPSAENAKATLHDGKVPTLESYRAAASIVREVDRWTLTGPAKVDDCTVEVTRLLLADLNDDELPYAHLRPGKVMEFTASAYEGLEAATATHYVWPLPMDEQIYFFDCPRVWIGETTELGQPVIHLHTTAADDHGHEINYRLTFPSREAIRETLYKGFAPTQATFDAATKIVREDLIMTGAPVAPEPDAVALLSETLASVNANYAGDTPGGFFARRDRAVLGLIKKLTGQVASLEAQLAATRPENQGSWILKVTEVTRAEVPDSHMAADSIKPCPADA